MSRTTTAAALGVALLALAGCGDKRLDRLSAGISKDSAIALMGQNPDRVDPFLTQGKYIEAMYFGRPGAAPGSTPEDKLQPVVVVDGTIQVWGWDDWEEFAAQYQIPAARK